MLSLPGICDCQSTRDTFLYAASVDSRGLEPTVEILGEVVLRPQFSPEELEMCEMTIRYELEDILVRARARRSELCEGSFF